MERCVVENLVPRQVARQQRGDAVTIARRQLDPSTAQKQFVFGPQFNLGVADRDHDSTHTGLLADGLPVLSQRYVFSRPPVF